VSNRERLRSPLSLVSTTTGPIVERHREGVHLRLAGQESDDDHAMPLKLSDDIGDGSSLQLPLATDLAGDLFYGVRVAPSGRG
jgi:hypothetical protein